MRISHTMTALLLTALAVALPCGAWYVVGSREASREAARLEQEPLEQAREIAVLQGKRLAARLESLLQTESRRPFYHYQNLYHDPKGAHAGASVVPSPLAQGPADPLVRAYFQVDSTGRLTLPTLNPEVPDLNPKESLAGERALLKELQPGASQYLRALGLEPQPARRVGSSPSSGARARPEPPSAAASLESPRQSASDPAQARQAPLSLPTQQTKLPSKIQQIEVLDPAAYAQNVQANQVYAQLKQAQSAHVARPSSPALSTGQREVVIGVGAFEWFTLPVGGTRSLAALREVARPEGTMAQGFVLSLPALAEGLKEAAFPASLMPPDVGEHERGIVTAPIAGTSWHVAVNPAKAAPVAQARAKEVTRRFQRSLLVGMMLAALAGLLVVGVVWQAERLARQRSQFAAAAAHELRTPLAGLRMYGEMIAEGLGDPARSRDYARRVADEAERLGRVVANVLGFSRLERGALAVRPERGDLAAALRDCVARLQPALEAAGAQVELNLPQQPLVVRFDREALFHMVQNLLDNAEKYARSAANRTIHVSLTAMAAGLNLSVVDHGSGIPSAERKHLFRPFARSRQFNSPAGLGLGLVLVDKLARAHGGEVRYASAPDGGAMFTIVLPVDPHT